MTRRRDEPLFDVVLTIELRTRIDFARGSGLDDDDEITKADAIANAVGCLPTDVYDGLMDGFGGEFEQARIRGHAAEVA